VQLFPEDGALMQQMSVRSDLSVGAILEPDKDDYRNVWNLIPVTSSYGSSAKPVADLSIIQQYLEEFIICCKACFEAYEKRSSAYTLFSCASANSYISNNFYQAYMALQSQWEVECRGVSQNYRDCVMEILESYFILVKEEVIAPPNVATSSEVRSSGSEDCIPLYDEGLEYFAQMASVNEIIREYKQEQTSELEAKHYCSKAEEAGEAEEKEFKREQERLEQKKRAERQAAQEATEKERQDIKYEEPCESEEDYMYMTPLRREYEQTRRTRSKNHLESNTPPTATATFATATFTIIFALFSFLGPGASKPFFGILTAAGIVVTYKLQTVSSSR
jgi:hypothetical protein